MKRLAVLTAAIALLAAAPARAELAYPGQAPVTDARSLAAIDVALTYWRDRNLTACPAGVATYMADTLPDYATGLGGSCAAWLARQPLHDERTYLDFPTTVDRRVAAQHECAMWTHELGHALGLGHTSDGTVMDPQHLGMPVACVLWARTAFPARHRLHRRIRARRP